MDERRARAAGLYRAVTLPVLGPFTGRGVAGLEAILGKLAAAPDAPDRARHWAHLAYLEWLAGLPGSASFPVELRAARRRCAQAAPDVPAVDAFAALLDEAARTMPAPLALDLPTPQRRGGTRTRRLPF